MIKKGILFLLLMPLGAMAQVSSGLLEDSTIMQHKISQVVRTTYDNNMDSMLLEVMTESFDVKGRLIRVERLTNNWKQVDTIVYGKRISKTSTYTEISGGVEGQSKSQKLKIPYYKEKSSKKKGGKVPDVTLDSLMRPVRYYNPDDGYFALWKYDEKGHLIAKRTGYDFGYKSFGELTDSMYYDANNRLCQTMTFTPGQYQNMEMKPELKNSVWYYYNRRGLRSSMITSEWYGASEPQVYRYHYHYSFFD